MANGQIKQIIGAVIDVSFAGSGAKLPKINNALTVARPDGSVIILECQRHLGEDSVRTISMDSTDGMMRGMEVIDTGAPISVPTGDAIRGRLFNVVGDAIDGMGNIPAGGERYSIHRNPPAYEDLSTESEVLFTGIKVIDLIAPYSTQNGLMGYIGSKGNQCPTFLRPIRVVITF